MQKRTIASIAAAVIGAGVAGWRLGVFAPVGECLRRDAWPAALIALHVVGDGLTFIPYVGMPIVLVFVIWMRLKTRPAANLLYLFGAFIVLCGWTHINDIIAIVHPFYWFTGIIKLATGLVSCATLVKLIQLVPTILAFGTQAADLAAARDEAERLKKDAEARATRAEGEVSELEQVQAKLKAALKQAEDEKARAERLGRDALESARIAEAARSQAEAAISEKAQVMRAVRDLSTPVLPVMDRILAMPLIGTVDSMRAEQAIESIMNGVADHQAEVLILDLTGVPVVDTQVADAILKAAAGVRLLGATCIITGIRPAVAQTIVTLGIDMATINTRGTLKAGLKAAMAMVKG